MRTNAVVLCVVVALVTLGQCAPSVVSLEAEYPTTSTTGWTVTSRNQLMSCGYIIKSSTSSKLANTYQFTAEAGTYALWGRVQMTQVGSTYYDGCYLQFDAQTEWIWEGGWPCDFGWPEEYAMVWKPAMNVTFATSGTHTLKVSTLRMYPVIDKFLLLPPGFDFPGANDLGPRASNIPVGAYCESKYFEVEWGTKAATTPPSFVAVQGASEEGAMVLAGSSQQQCSTSARYMQISQSWGSEASAYKPLWVRVLASSSPSSLFVIEGGDCTEYISFPYSPEFQWVKWDYYSTGSTTLKLGWRTPNVYFDRVYIGFDTPVDSVLSSGRPTSAPSCSQYNGLCDAMTTCVSVGTCSACPFGYDGGSCSYIPSCPAGCTVKLPYGCYYDRLSYVAALTDSMTFGTTQLTVDAWMQPSPRLDSTDYVVLEYRSDASPASVAFQVRYSKTLGITVVLMGTTLFPSPAVSLTLGNWHHVAVTWSSATRNVQIFVNNALKSTLVDSRSGITLSSPGVMYLFGKTKTDAVFSIADNPPVSFSIDEVHVWDAVMPLATLALYYNAPIVLSDSPANLIHSFSFGSTYDPFTSGTQICPTTTADTFNSNVHIYIRPNDEIALRNFYLATKGSTSWNADYDWLQGHPCNGNVPNWFGLDCVGGFVISLNLAYNDIDGHFPEYYGEPFFTALQKVQLLLLQGNKIAGPIPDSIGDMGQVTTIYLENNLLTSVPATLNKLTLVDKIYLNNNLLSGSIPQVFSTMAKLKYLVLSFNTLTGNIPSSLASCATLKYLDISNNKLTGTVPVEVVNSQIFYMDFSNNTLSGSLTNRATVDNADMIQIDLANNAFRCMMPPFLRSTATIFRVVLTGSIFMCPITGVPSSVVDAVCDPVVLVSVNPNPYNIELGFGVNKMTIVATGTYGCVGIQVVMGPVGPLPVTFTSPTTMELLFPALPPARYPLRLMWFGTFYNDTVVSTNSIEVTYFKPCPVGCIAPWGVCTGLTGECQCQAGYTGPTCRDLACPGNCNSHGYCNTTTGLCECYSPYFGLSCGSASMTCPNDCTSHGICDIFTGVCSCYVEYWGNDCSQKACPPYNKPYCGEPDHGTCDGATGICGCLPGWTGPACNIPIKDCPNNCTDSNHGNCNLETGVCTCFEYNGLKYGGVDCSQVVCIPACGYGGYCNTSSSLCVCPVGRFGPDCSILYLTCPNDCTDLAHGDCNHATGVCACVNGFTGSDCSERVCPGVPECSAPNGTCNTVTGVCNCVNNSLTTGEYYVGYYCQYEYFNCPNACSGASHGSCNPTNGKCTCIPPYSVALAADCSKAACPNNCNYHGTCNEATGVCTCAIQYNTTDDCEFLYIACTVSCHNGSCDTTTGQCVCSTGWGNLPPPSTEQCTMKLCPLDCSGNGVCNNGVCTCDPGWGGLGCDHVYFPCAGDCNKPAGAGLCNESSGECICYGSYYGDNCQYLKCLTSVPGTNCSGHGTCNSATGQCACQPGWEPPDCYVNLCTLNDFCTSYIRGTCNTTKGECVCIPPYTGTSCENKLCTVACVNGVCNITTGECDCDGTHTGAACDQWWISCPPSPSNECSGHGSCDHNTGVCTCEATYFMDGCTQQLCPNNCSSHGTCNLNTGTCTCDTGYQDPNDPSCMNPYLLCPLDCSGVDNGYCMHDTGLCFCFPGYYGDSCEFKSCPPRCLEHGTCNTATGICECDQWWNGTSCLTPTKPCPNDCSGHGVCNHIDGACQCSSPYKLPDCQYASCLMNCSYPHGVCDTATGVCACGQYYSGNGCQIANLTCGACVNGFCDSTTGNCVCLESWYGTSCNLKRCPGFIVCSGHGTCNDADGTCVCQTHFSGPACEIANYSCMNDCTAASHGVCDWTRGLCSCAYPYYGNDCSSVACPNNCWSHGTCDQSTGLCTCVDPYQLPDCFFMECPNDCSGHGTCNRFTGQCSCETDWDLDDCSLQLCPYDCSGAGDCNSGECDCRFGTKGDGCEKGNWGPIIGIAVGGSVLLVGASVGSFLMVRYWRIRRFKKMHDNQNYEMK